MNSTIRKSIALRSLKASLMDIRKYRIVLMGIFLFSLTVNYSFGQAPNWEYSGDYPVTMSGVYSVSDECIPSADPNDIIGAFDINGEVRGVAQTDVGNQAFITIGANNNGEKIFFKVYDASTNSVYNIHSYTVDFSSGARLGPLVINFDSNPTSTSGGSDQWVVGANSTNMAASGSGMWSLISGGGGAISDPSDPQSMFSGVIGTTYLLAWTLSDSEGCIGETDEVSVTFALAQSEDTPERCSDGVDNDGNGLTDCQESACGKPTLGDITIMQPTALTCSSAMADGAIVISHMSADSFSIDDGVTFQTSSSFSGLAVGEYQIVIKNDFADCTDTDVVSLVNTLNQAPPVPAFSLSGPAVICKGSAAVNYYINQPLNGSLSWSYTGDEATITMAGINSEIDFGENATAGTLTAVMSNACSSKSASIEIGMANSFLCSQYSNCLRIVDVPTSLLENANISHIFQASDVLNSDAQLSGVDYEFSAGQSLNFNSGFSIEQGLSFTADIKTCSN